MQASAQHRVLADAILPDLGSQTKVGGYIRDAVLVVGFAILMALCAQIVIKLPGTVVPITGQTFGPCSREELLVADVGLSACFFIC